MTIKRSLIFLIAASTLLGGLWPAFSQGDDPIFVQANPEALYEAGGPGDWNFAYNDPGAVLYHDGQFHMFQNGFDGWPSTSGIGYYTSEDGINWQAQSEGPIFRSGDHIFDGFALVATSVVVTEDGQWRLYLTQLKARSSSNIVGLGFRVAVADDPLGEWALLDDFILEPGAVDEWDQRQISDPMVLPTTDGYVMYYSGFDRLSEARIGMATSSDGLVWAKYDDPSTTDAPFVDSDPIVERSLEWERGVHYPAVVESDEGYVMVYRSPSFGSAMRLGMAISQDGLQWVKYDDPIYAPNAIEGNGTTNITSLVYVDGTYFMYVDGFVRSSFSLTYVLTHEGPLFPVE
jgi:predicted GH43/DUF377 family glycosyl hydrolase